MSPVCDKPQASFRLFVSVLCLPWALLCHLLAVWQTTILCSLPSLGFSLPFFSCLANNIHLLELSFLFFCFPCPWFFFAFLCISARQRSFSSSRIRLFRFLFRCCAISPRLATSSRRVWVLLRHSTIPYHTYHLHLLIDLISDLLIDLISGRRERIKLSNCGLLSLNVK